MKFALMQPYFFPYVGYFSLIHSVEHFMFFDDVQFTKKSWMSRNRLLNIEKGEPFYIRPDIEKPKYREYLQNVQLDENGNWKERLLQQINGYKNKARHYNDTVKFLHDLLDCDFKGLSDLNVRSTMLTANYLGIERIFDKFTDHNFWFDEKPDIGDWGRVVADKVGATHYINSPGGGDFIFSDKFDELGMKLGFVQPNLKEYRQGVNAFTPGLSIIDVLLFNGREKTAEMVEDYKIKWAE